MRTKRKRLVCPVCVGLIVTLMLQREAGVVLMMRASSGQCCILFRPSAFSVHSHSCCSWDIPMSQALCSCQRYPSEWERERERIERGLGGVSYSSQQEITRKRGWNETQQLTKVKSDYSLYINRLALGSPAHHEISLVQNHPSCPLHIKCFLIGCDCDSGGEQINRNKFLLKSYI